MKLFCPRTADGHICSNTADAIVLTLFTMADVHQLVPEQRVRKRRRRTVACTQCRSRKLRCDREYPVCGRCVKSRTPGKCTYEDGILWQQPSTVSSTAFNPDRHDNNNSSRDNNNNVNVIPKLLPRVVDASPSPDSGLRPLSTSADARPPLDLVHAQEADNAQQHQAFRSVPLEKKDHFLETVLGAPKTDEPFVPAEVVQRSQYPERSRGTQLHLVDCDDDGGFASPSQQLDILPRIMMRGTETRTRFNGAGILANLVAQVKLPLNSGIAISYLTGSRSCI